MVSQTRKQPLLQVAVVLPVGPVAEVAVAQLVAEQGDNPVLRRTLGLTDDGRDGPPRPIFRPEAPPAGQIYTVRPHRTYAARSYFFASGFQFWISVIGAVASSSTVLMRKRPSRVTS